MTGIWERHIGSIASAVLLGIRPEGSRRESSETVATE
jgi:hypothetical protein